MIPAGFPEEKVGRFGDHIPMGRAGQPEEAAGCCVFLAPDEASYVAGRVLRLNGGDIVNGSIACGRGRMRM